jgi:NAD(P)-dependent dehydrogenase (short-subunit alcohol dehydrogenase family)
MTALRPGVLTGRTVALAGSAQPLHGALSELGARVEAAPATSADAVVYDATPTFGDGGPNGLAAASAQAWTTIRQIVADAMIPDRRPGKVVVIAPRPDAGAFAAAARAALENLARTLSVEWARYGITATAIAPGASSTDDQVAELVCFLISPAGDYFSGCVFSLGVSEPAA